MNSLIYIALELIIKTEHISTYSINNIKTLII